jgi:hypothetical protein
MDMHGVTGTRRADQPARALRNTRGPGPGVSATTIPPAVEPGHGLGAILRRHRIRSGPGRADGGNTALFDLICYDCGDDPGLDYSHVPSRLQWLRGPRTMKDALAAYERHLGLGR